MQTAFYLLTHFPFLAAVMAVFLPRFLHIPLVIGAVCTVIGASLFAVMGYAEPFAIALPHWLEPLLTTLDFALLAFFAYAGFRHRSKLTAMIALAQITLLAVLHFGGSQLGFEQLGFEPNDHAAYAALRVDSLTLAMWLLISCVGVLIALYAITYMDYEETTALKRQAFVAFLLAFVGVMNLLVAADSIAIFFLLFELTTFASFVLIGWRRDDAAVANAVRALWTNQIGGALLLGAMLLLAFAHEPLYFSVLIANGSVSGVILPAFALLCAAALIKGAQMPFDRWLLGAMVAPTPVSAILHSSTMVKIAPFMIIKFSTLIGTSLLGLALSLYGGFVFVVAAYLALGRSMLKEVLAYSTISLLGLMILLAAIATPLSICAAVALLIFHGVTKAMLFMEAGVIEKLYGSKNLDHMGHLVTKAPMSVFLMLFGFASVTLPPFGALVSKWIALEASLKNPFIFVFIALGSVILTLLYFKVVCYMLGVSGQVNSLKMERQPFSFSRINGFLGLALIVSALFIAPLFVWLFAPIAAEITGAPTRLALDGLSLVMPTGGRMEFWQILGSLLLIVLVPALAFWNMRGVDRVREYSGGERLEKLPSVTFYFTAGRRTIRALYLCSFGFLAATLIAGVLQGFSTGFLQFLQAFLSGVLP